MTFDTTPLERDCVLLNCSQPAVAPLQGRVHCAKHDPNPPAPPPLVAVGPDPDTMVPTPAAPAMPDMATMQPVWDGTQFVLRPKQPPAGPDLDRLRGLVRELMTELGITEADL